MTIEIAIIAAVVVVVAGVALWMQFRKQPEMVVKINNPGALSNTIHSQH